MTASPARLAATLGHGMSEHLAAQLLSSDRFRPRLVGLLEAHLGALPDLGPPQARALRLDEPGLAALARQAGAVWHGNTIAALVDGASVRALADAMGEELRLVALRGRHLAPPAAAAAAEEIASDIPAAGARCLSDWCALQPEPVRARIALRLEAGWTAARQEGGAAIVAWLLAQPA